MLKKGLFIITIITIMVFSGLIFKANTVNAEEYDAKMVSVNTYYNDPIANGIKTQGLGRVRFVTKVNRPIETIIENQTAKIEVSIVAKSFKI